MLVKDFILAGDLGFTISEDLNWTNHINDIVAIRYSWPLWHITGPDSLVVRASASGSEGRGFAPRPRHTKGVKNGTGSSLADALNKRVVCYEMDKTSIFMFEILEPEGSALGKYSI